MRHWCDRDDERVEVLPIRRLVRRRVPRQLLPKADGGEEVGGAWQSEHAHLRMAQRRVTPSQVAYVVTYGDCIHRAGCDFYMLRQCDIPPADLGSDWAAKLEGAVVLMDGNAIITVYRNRRAYHAILKKEKYGLPAAA